MVKALFYIEGEKAPVQHIGCRLKVTAFLIQQGITKGGAFNLPDGRVEVILEGEKEKLIDIHNELKNNLYEWLKKDSDDAQKLKERLGNPGLILSNLEYNEKILVLDIGLFSHSLTFDQIYKGVDVYEKMANAIEKLNKTLDTMNKERQKN